MKLPLHFCCWAEEPLLLSDAHAHTCMIYVYIIYVHKCASVSNGHVVMKWRWIFMFSH